MFNALKMALKFQILPLPSQHDEYLLSQLKLHV